MTKQFEQLIEYVINDETEKAKELFHDIVVAKSREIYESIMEDEEEESIGGDASDSLIDDVETEEEGMYEDGEEEEEEGEEEEEEGEEEEESGADDFEAGEDEVEAGEEDEDLEDRVVDLEDKLDELMAEFETLMGDEAAEHGDEVEVDDFEMEPVDDEVGGDAFATDDTSEFTNDEEEFMENVSLKAAPKPVTAEPAGTNTKATTAFNSGAVGAVAKPVKGSAAESNPDGTSAYKAPTSYADKGRGDLPGAGNFKNVPGKDGSKLAAAPKPVTSQASGVNTKTPFPKA